MRLRSRETLAAGLRVWIRAGTGTGRRIAAAAIAARRLSRGRLTTSRRACARLGGTSRGGLRCISLPCGRAAASPGLLSSRHLQFQESPESMGREAASRIRRSGARARRAHAMLMRSRAAISTWESLREGTHGPATGKARPCHGSHPRLRHSGILRKTCRSIAHGQQPALPKKRRHGRTGKRPEKQLPWGSGRCKASLAGAPLFSLHARPEHG